MKHQPVTMTVEIDFTCPFCGKHACVVKPAGILHDMPPCPQFVELDLVSYLHEVNEKLAVKDLA